MLKLILLLAFLANLNLVLTETVVYEEKLNKTAEVASPIDESRIRIRCGPNQVFDSCPLCPTRTCKAKDTLVTCLIPVKPGNVICPRPRCRCADGYYSNDEGKCVLREECPPQCGRNEVPSNCANNGCLPNCARPDLDTYCKPNPANCKPGCVCAEGYLRDENGVCIPRDKCPNKCKENEEYSTCPNNICREKTCKDVGYLLACYRSDNNITLCEKPTCICKDGYVRNEDGVCILMDECPCGGDPNAGPGCGTFCNRCTKNYPCPRICQLHGCDCRKGYVYDDTNKKCVLPEQCPPQCGRNEVPSDCANNGCLPNCARPDLHTYCRPNPANCKPGCICAKGYLRDENGICVQKEKCPIKCKENEEYSTCPNHVCREKTCEDVGYLLTCLISDYNCTACEKPTCICKDGYVRNRDGVCILRDECPCGGDPNAWPGCGTFCNRCNKNYPCPRICHLSGCDCRKGYVYDDINKKCVLPEQCPPQCGRNEVPSDCANNGCLPNCARPDLHTYCKPNPANCKPGCICAEGYLRDENGICVQKEKCPIKCKENEEYSTCPNHVCREKTCEEVGYLLACYRSDNNITLCEKPTCICKDGYVRNRDGVCILMDECPCGGDPNAGPGCGTFCNRCNKNYPCPRRCQLHGCDCRKGYVYDDINKKCVLPEQCPPQCGRNEVSSNCGNNECLPNCARPDLDTYCKPNPANCKPGCICAEGYLRDENGVCVPREKCPITECKKNEEYVNCTNLICRAESCEDLGYPLPCFQLDRVKTECGKPGCVCRGGFIKNKENDCIPIEECPSCGGDPNAQSGCGTFCTTCFNYKNENRMCIMSCRINSCDCRPGFVYDQNKRKCILPEQCLKCGRNEVLSDCANSPCIKNCASKDLNLECKPYPRGCEPGCVCDDGYLRDGDGICVPIEKCPTKGIPGTDTSPTL